MSKPKPAAEIAVAMMSRLEAQGAVQQINAHLDSVRKLILELWQREGWKALGYASWRECVVAEFQEAERTLYKQLNAAQVETMICPNGQIGSIPEGQLRPLSALRNQPEELCEAWQMANERTNGQPTGKDVQRAVDEILERRPRESELKTIFRADDERARFRRNAEAWNAGLDHLRHEIFLLTNSIPRRGGIVVLTAKWPELQIRATVTHLRRLRDSADEWIPQLEEVLNAIPEPKDGGTPDAEGDADS